ncbi:PREDICTED: ATP-dependent DNA helicase homolog RECG, chloroplastic isoform X2 [Ipomoea nil]|uniref:ATP-dependent DNA helicase homolog RECG, chloroplastic isoform X1 n=1 Tax=Ipomoea nil TaxID=35883 RepID=UPI00090196ED|nr:PREDICTED: ATP-dependent DNA helicase homolog RECG, chloroplastic isoform X1 [Ipomoea nil]XP_019167644.1 PREDICTED: ATP-dependent DNA helicase homolog RECG, chloroplastic isoform X1 [Ipomoea nil]XP_019167645.1 PREDICTED: ATP-dependent DNA helicase homolog RECG, chloroplastic isoform X1 [Ipomoea nil]XP_019167646.1 PREDICTED: ATP-dependent DNA helicase homolog RECG, chloroplastic isoform X1 [Ipomoea nil]XP_019167647.1 PREDICTED: ATP-dependent DNA helicase homolog RECG, chloroplastic isoform X2
MAFCEKCLRGAITFEVERGYSNALGRNMRFSNLLFSRMSTLFSRSKHKLAKRLLEEVDAYDRASVPDQSKLLSKVSVLMGYDGLNDLIDNERDISLVCRKFPSIILGYSEPIELFDVAENHSKNSGFLAAQISKGLFSKPVDSTLVSTDSVYETWQSQDIGSPGVDSSSSTAETIETEVREELQSTVVKPVTHPSLEIQEIAGSVEMLLDKSISCITGLSKRHCHQLENCGFHTLRKLLQHFPRTYVDLYNAQVGIEDGKYMIFVGKILSSRALKASSSLSFLEVIVSCEIPYDAATTFSMTGDADCVIDKTVSRGGKTIILHLKKFFRGTRFTYLPFLRSLQGKQKVGDVVCVSGKVRTMHTKDHYEMKEYNMDVLQAEEDSHSHICVERRPYPIYPSKGGLKPNFLREIISRAMKFLPVNIDPIPEEIRQDFGLPSLYDAFSGIHQPKSLLDAELARKRLIFDEFFYLQLGRLFQMLQGLNTKLEKDALLNKCRKPELNTVDIDDWSFLSRKFLATLPYSLTPSQLIAISEIMWDLKRPVPMNRLLQGDVGCGKTVVAFLACMEVISSGYQAAFMVPTELLAVQHYEHLLKLLENLEEVVCKPSVALLTGSTPSKQSRLIRMGLQTGDISLVIGTHSLIAENVEFSALRIAVVDEQHRFGVVQRGLFNGKLFLNSTSSKKISTGQDDSSKGSVLMAPHVLAMSATPIPRSLALALYGDMSLTQITDLPPGRIPVETYAIEGNESGFEEVYKMMMEELEIGGKIYLVYPVIEQSEQLPQLRAAAADLEIISSRFSAYRCGLLHGRMKSDEKSEALRQFRTGETDILLSTQVIEIGVDVPDATMMVVMNAERFGIAQLHQLRGRVGRGDRKSKCILLASTTSGLNRVKVLEKSSDCFYLANMDLLMRGPGDLLGKKQSGHLPEFPVARLEIDGNVLQEAHLAALRILSDSIDLEKFPYLKAELSMRQPLSLLGD